MPPNNTEPSPLGTLTREQLAYHFGIEASTLLDWENNEGLPVIEVGRTRLYSVGAVTKWLLKRSRVKKRKN